MSLEGSVRGALDRLEPRERRMLGVLGAMAATMLLCLIPYGIGSMVSSRRDDVQALERAISDIKANREVVRARQARRDAVLARYANKAPPLGSLIEKAAKDQKLDVPESQDRPEQPHGKKYVERGTMVRLRKASMLQLGKMLEALEQTRMPVTLSRLDVRRRPGEHDSYDVELGVSAFDRAADGAKAPRDDAKDKDGKDGKDGGAAPVPGGGK